MMIFPESLHALDEVSGLIFCKIFVYVYIYRILHDVYTFQMDECIFYEFCVSLNVYLQCTMFD